MAQRAHLTSGSKALMLHILKVKKSIKVLESKTIPFCEKFEFEAPSVYAKLKMRDPLWIFLGRTSVVGGASSVATSGFIWVYRLEVEAERRGSGKRRFKCIKTLSIAFHKAFNLLMPLNLLFPNPLLSASTFSSFSSR
ncbi:hypothetical protein OROMI_014030 [Orobanche minor]